MSVRAVDHVNIVTEQLEATRAFFGEVLGLEVGPRPAFAVTGYWLYAGDRAVVHIQEADAAGFQRHRLGTLELVALHVQPDGTAVGERRVERAVVAVGEIPPDAQPLVDEDLLGIVDAKFDQQRLIFRADVQVRFCREHPRHRSLSPRPFVTVITPAAS